MVPGARPCREGGGVCLQEAASSVAGWHEDCCGIKQIKQASINIDESCKVGQSYNAAAIFP